MTLEDKIAKLQQDVEELKTYAPSSASYEVLKRRIDNYLAVLDSTQRQLDDVAEKIRKFEQFQSWAQEQFRGQDKRLDDMLRRWANGNSD